MHCVVLIFVLFYFIDFANILPWARNRPIPKHKGDTGGSFVPQMLEKYHGNFNLLFLE